MRKQRYEDDGLTSTTGSAFRIQVRKEPVVYLVLTFVTLLLGVLWPNRAPAVELRAAVQDAPHVTIRATTATAFENGSGAGVFLISREGSTAQPLAVRLRISGSAANGADYATILNEIQIPAGSSSIEFRIKPTDDTEIEPDELVTIGLADVALNSTLDNTLASLVIKDNDTVVQVEVSDPNGSESATRPTVFRISRNGNLRSQLVVAYIVNGSGGQIGTADGSVSSISDGTSNTLQFGDGSVRTISTVTTSGLDFVALPGTITLQPGETSKVLNVTPIDDLVLESRESVTISLLRSPLYTLGAANSAVGFFEDNDQPAVVRISTFTAQGTESGLHPIVFRFDRAVNLSGALTVSYSVNQTSGLANVSDGSSNTILIGETTTVANSGLDFNSLPGTITFQPGQSSVQLNVTPVDDNLPELTESVSISLLPGQLYTLATSSRATGFILDNDQPAPIVSISTTQPNANEGGPTNGIATVTRTGSLNAPVTVSYSINEGASNAGQPAINGVDFEQLSGQLIIPAGASSAAITVRPIADTENEAVERVVIKLLPAANGQVYSVQSGSEQATISIKDDHGRPGS